MFCVTFNLGEEWAKEVGLFDVFMDGLGKGLNLFVGVDLETVCKLLIFGKDDKEANINKQMSDKEKHTETAPPIQQQTTTPLEFNEYHRQFNFYGFLKAIEIVRHFSRITMGITTAYFFDYAQREEDETPQADKSKDKSSRNRNKNGREIQICELLYFWRNIAMDLLFDKWDALRISAADDNILGKWAIQELLSASDSDFGTTFNGQQQSVGGNANENCLSEKEKLLVSVARLGFFQSAGIPTHSARIVPIIRKILQSRAQYLLPMGASLDLATGHMKDGKESSQLLQVSYCPTCKQKLPKTAAASKALAPANALLEEVLAKLAENSSSEESEAYFAWDPQAFGALLEALLSSGHTARYLTDPKWSAIERLNEARQRLVIFGLNTIRIEYTYAFYEQKQKQKQMQQEPK